MLAVAGVGVVCGAALALLAVVGVAALVLVAAGEAVTARVGAGGAVTTTVTVTIWGEQPIRARLNARTARLPKIHFAYISLAPVKMVTQIINNIPRSPLN